MTTEREKTLLSFFYKAIRSIRHERWNCTTSQTVIAERQGSTLHPTVNMALPIILIEIALTSRDP